MQDPALWQRIAAHHMDAPTGTAPYSVKLAQAEGWDKAYTKQVIDEYKRFVYLTQISPDQVTPSEDIDRAWHMHLTFTRDYWEVFCAKVLGQPLHHEPCAGQEDMPRYRAQFAATMTLYDREFGCPTNPQIWGKKTGWRAVIIGFLVGATGAGLLLFASVFALLEVKSLVVIATLMIFAGWGYAVIKLPQQNRKPSAATVAAGCGTSGCGGCGGCGG